MIVETKIKTIIGSFEKSFNFLFLKLEIDEPIRKEVIKNIPPKNLGVGEVISHMMK